MRLSGRHRLVRPACRKPRGKENDRITGDNKWDSGIVRSASELTPQQQAAGIFLSSLHDADANKEKAFISSIETGKFS